MATKDRKLHDLKEDLATTKPVFDRSGSRETRHIRRVHPLGLRVVARILKGSDVTEGGLYLPEGAKETLQESILAEVIEVASAVDCRTEEETNVSGIPLGAKVLVPKSAGLKVPWEDELRIIDTRDILALVDEIELT